MNPKNAAAEADSSTTAIVQHHSSSMNSPRQEIFVSGVNFQSFSFDPADYKTRDSHHHAAKRTSKLKCRSNKRRPYDNKVQIVVRDPRLEMTSKSQLSDKRSLMKSNRHTTSDRMTENSPIKVNDNMSGRNSQKEATFQHLTNEKSLTAEEGKKNTNMETVKLIHSVDMGRLEEPYGGKGDLMGSAQAADKAGSPRMSESLGGPGLAEAEHAHVSTYNSIAKSPASRKERPSSSSRQNFFLSRKAQLQPRQTNIIRSSHVFAPPLKNVKVHLRSKKKKQASNGDENKLPKKQQINVNMKHDNSVITEYELISPVEKTLPNDELSSTSPSVLKQHNYKKKLEQADGGQPTERQKEFFGDLHNNSRGAVGTAYRSKRVGKQQGQSLPPIEIQEMTIMNQLRKNNDLDTLIEISTLQSKAPSLSAMNNAAANLPRKQKLNMNTINLINGSMSPSHPSDPLQRLSTITDYASSQKNTGHLFRQSCDYETPKALKGFVSRQKGQRVGNSAFLKLTTEPRQRHLIVNKNDEEAIVVKHQATAAKASPRAWDCRGLFKPGRPGPRTEIPKELL